jgi:hypothetical protein
MGNTYVLILAGVAVAIGLGFIVMRRLSGQGAEKQSGD